MINSFIVSILIVKYLYKFVEILLLFDGYHGVLSYTIYYLYLPDRYQLSYALSSLVPLISFISPTHLES